MALESTKLPPRLRTAIDQFRANDKRLTELRLPSIFKYLDDERCIAFSAILASNTTLVSLDVSFSEFQAKGCIALCTALASNFTLTCLDLRGVKIQTSGCVALSNLLTLNSTLTTLKLGFRIPESGEWEALSKGLALNSGLTELDLSQSLFVDDKSFIVVASALASNTTLTSLNLDTCLMQENGANAFLNAFKTNTSLTSLNSNIFDQSRYSCFEKDPEIPAGLRHALQRNEHNRKMKDLTLFELLRPEVL